MLKDNIDDNKFSAAVEAVLVNQKSKIKSAKKLPVGGDESDDNVSATVAMFSSETLKQHVSKYMAAIERKDQANADVKSALDAAERAGIPKAELKFYVKNTKKQMSEDFKATVNIMCNMMGQLELFYFSMGNPNDASMIQRH